MVAAYVTKRTSCRRVLLWIEAQLGQQSSSSPQQLGPHVGSCRDSMEALCRFPKVTGGYPEAHNPVTHLPMGLQHPSGEWLMPVGPDGGT